MPSVQSLAGLAQVVDFDQASRPAKLEVVQGPPGESQSAGFVEAKVFAAFAYVPALESLPSVDYRKG